VARILTYCVVLAVFFAGWSKQWCQDDCADTAEGKLFVAVHDAVVRNDKAYLFKTIAMRWPTLMAADPTEVEAVFHKGRDILISKKLKFGKFTNWKRTYSLQDGQTSEIDGTMVESENPANGYLFKAFFSGPVDNLTIVDVKIGEFKGWTESSEETPRLSLAYLAALTIWQWFPVALVVISTAVCLSGFAASLLSKTLKRKWLWEPFCLIGLFPVTINLANGDLALNPFSLTFLGGGLLEYVATFRFFIVAGGTEFGKLDSGSQTAVLAFPFGAVLLFITLWDGEGHIRGKEKVTTAEE
jgi:hypothetical protein